VSRAVVARRGRDEAQGPWVGAWGWRARLATAIRCRRAKPVASMVKSWQVSSLWLLAKSR
jgi:hypothetical protein